MRLGGFKESSIATYAAPKSILLARCRRAELAPLGLHGLSKAVEQAPLFVTSSDIPSSKNICHGTANKVVSPSRPPRASF